MARRTPSEKRPEGLPAPQPWVPPSWEIADASALQSLGRGDASPDQQRRALRYIIERLAGTYDLSFRPTSDRDTCFAEGRRFVGLQITKLLNLSLAHFRERKDGEPPAPSEQG